MQHHQHQQMWYRYFSDNLSNPFQSYIIYLVLLKKLQFQSQNKMKNQKNLKNIFNKTSFFLKKEEGNYHYMNPKNFSTIQTGQKLNIKLLTDQCRIDIFWQRLSIPQQLFWHQLSICRSFAIESRARTPFPYPNVKLLTGLRYIIGK